MRRFLNRYSVANRLVTVLTLSVVIPGVVLAYYGVQAVLQEETLYQATLRNRAESTANFLFRDLGERMRQMLGQLDDAAAGTAGSWATDPAAAAKRLRAAEPLASSVLVLDAGSKLRYPTRAATGLLARTSGTTSDRSHVEPFVLKGERLEFEAEQWLAAAAAYAGALDVVPGQRGRGIVLNARARSLLKAGEAEQALAVYQEIATKNVGDLDFNDFPLDLLARFQSAIALRNLDRPAEAAEQLVDLLDVLLKRPWTFGGYGELALARQAIELLGNQGLLRELPPARRPDLATVRRRVSQDAGRQADQALLLALVPALTSEAAPLEARGSHFQLDDAQAGGRTLLLAHRWFDRGDQQRRLVVQLDDRALRRQISAALATAARANPEFHTALHRSSPDLLEGMGRGIRVVRPLDPWLPGYSLVITSTENGLFGPERRKQSYVRLGMIAALLITIFVGMLVIVRAVAREVEIARLKSDFVSNVSHELRTPLTTIRIMAEMLSMGAVPTAEKQAEYHKNIVSEAERLTRLINNVLDFARIEEGRKKFQFGMGDMADIIYEVERITGDYVRSEGFELSVDVQDDMPASNFDRDAMIQAMINLMSNAVKYSREDKRITMGASEDRDTIRVWVTDHGPGIDPQDVPHLFEKFYRAGDHMTREVGGTGLGLAIVKHIAAAHGGRVEVESVVGVGSTFRLVLPLSQGD